MSVQMKNEIEKFCENNNYYYVREFDNTIEIRDNDSHLIIGRIEINF